MTKSYCKFRLFRVEIVKNTGFYNDLKLMYPFLSEIYASCELAAFILGTLYLVSWPLRRKVSDSAMSGENLEPEKPLITKTKL